MVEFKSTITFFIQGLKTILKVPNESIYYKSYSDLLPNRFHDFQNLPIGKELLRIVESNKKISLFSQLSDEKTLTSLYDPSDKIEAFVGIPVLDTNNNILITFYVFFDKKHGFTKATEDLINIISKQTTQIYNKDLHIEILEKENHLLNNENNYCKKIIDSAEAGSWFWDIQNKELTISDRWAEIIGYTKDELAPINFDKWANLVFEEDFKIAEKAIESCFLNKSDYYNVIFRMKHKNGYWVWVSSSGYITDRSKNKTPLYMVGCHIDITSQKKEEEISKRNKWHLDDVQKLINIGNWSYDIVSNKFKFSQGFMDIFKSLNPKSFEDILSVVVKEDKAKVEKAKMDCITFGKPFEVKYRIEKLNGEFLYIEEHGFAVKDELENVTNIYGAVHDFTEKKKEEQHLKLLESVITNTRDAVLITEAEPFDEPGPKIIYVNNAFTQMTGYTAEDVIGKSPRILQGPKSDFKALKKLGKALRNWESHEITTINCKKNGEEFWVNFSVTPVANESGWYTHWIAIERDVTEQMLKINSRNLIRLISEIFTRETTLNKSLSLSLLEILKFTNYSYGEIWLPNWNNEQSILLASKWLKTRVGDPEQLDRNKVLSLYDGIQGKILAEDKFFILEQSENGDLFKKLNSKNKAHLITALGIPLKSKNETVGVLLLFAEEQIKESSIPKLLLRELKIFLGKEIKRKSLEIEFNETFNFAPDIITINDNRNFLTKVNPAATSILGYSEKELLSQTFLNFIHPADRKATLVQTEVLRSGLPIYNFENRFITKSGKIVWLSWTATPSFRNGLTYSVAKDVTEAKKTRKKLENLNKKLKKHSEDLEERNKQLKKIAWEQSHTVRAPLSRILGVIEVLDILDEQDISKEEKQLLLSNLKKSGTELDNIIRGVVKRTGF